MTEAPAELVGRVRDGLVAGDPRVAGGRVAGPELQAAVRRAAGGIADDAVLDGLRAGVEAELVGAGPLEPLLALRGVTDVLVNAPDQVWIDRGSGLQRAQVCFPDDRAVRRLAQRLAAAAGRRLDDAMPFVDAGLPDGTRLHAVLPPLARCTTLSLRVLARERYPLERLVTGGSIPPVPAMLLRALVQARLALVISGGTGCGKTTLLAALLGAADPRERLVLIEDAPELAVAHPHVVHLVTRAANVEGAGAVGLRDLVRQALRMRPDRLVVGEFRGAETVELLVALNTGHDGGAATVHANSAADVPSRLVALGGLGGLAADAVGALVASALQVVVHVRRDRTGLRRVTELAVLDLDERARLRATTAWDAAGAGPAAAALVALLRARGVVVAEPRDWERSAVGASVAVRWDR